VLPATVEVDDATEVVVVTVPTVDVEVAVVSQVVVDVDEIKV
jgi:hypothetical protein